MYLSLRKLVDAPTSTIHFLAKDESLAKPVLFYAKVLSSYLQGDLERLSLMEKALPLESFPAEWQQSLSILTVFRRKLRDQSITRADILSLEKENLADVFSAELAFCMAMGYEKIKEDSLCLKFFLQAAKLYRSFGCERKALRAHYNCVAAESRVYPYKNFVAEIQGVIELARSLQEPAYEGMALTMLSREYQVLGLFDKSLEMAKKSVVSLESERGSTHYFFAILHLAHIYLEKNEIESAMPLIQEAELATFPETIAARRLLLSSIDPKFLWQEDWERDLLPTWKNRIPQLKKRWNIHDINSQIQSNGTKNRDKIGNTNLEEKLLRLVYNGPIEKWDLITKIYPENSSPLQLENRFKNLLARVRKKYPNSVYCTEGRYHCYKIPSL